MFKASLEDTIVAIATPIGVGGIGIIRLSGKEALAIADKIFVSKATVKPTRFRSHTVHYGWIVRNRPTPRRCPPTRCRKGGKEIVDEVLLTVMRAPRSYTREDIVEISCHGGIVSLRAILNLALEYGARLAEPGEFTKRAFLNGRIDLAQAEAVLDIIQSRTDAFLKVSVHQLKGDLTIELENIREQLTDIYTELEAIVNFPEDDIDASGRRQIARKINAGFRRVERLLESSEHGRILKEGIKIVICGKPNVGKSSLLNVLLKQPRAIVSDIAGTTRDTIEETAQIQGIPFQLIDTAGILEPRDLIEKEAVKRSRLFVEGADLILFVLDASHPLTKQDRDLIGHVKDKNVLVVLNKCDLPSRIETKKITEAFADKRLVRISALRKKAIAQLEDAVVENVWRGRVTEPDGILISNVRHLDSLKKCAELIKTACQSLSENFSLEFVSEDIKEAVNYLDQITGKNIDSDLLDKIFSQFCIGK